MKKKLTYIFGFGLIFILISIVNIFITKPVFNSPDEASDYQVVREYGTNGHMYLTGKYLNIDYGNNLHPRGFITYHNKIVPFNFLGLPLFYGTFYTYFQDNIRYINIIFMLILIIYLYKITELFKILNKKSFGLIFIGVLGCLPLLYYFNFPYYNIIPFITFIIPFLYYIFKFNKSLNIKYLYFGLLFAFIAIWMRYEQVIFILLFLIINIIYNYKIYFYRKNLFFHIIGIIIFFIIIFLIPLLILNNNLYGNPLTYGYSLFTKTFFAEERTGNLIKSLTNIFFPSRRFDLQVLWINIKNNLFFILPVFYLLGYLTLFKKQIIKKYWPYFLIGIYIILYTGMSNTYGSGIDNITIRTSINRYWILINVLIIILVIYFIKNKYNFFIKIIFIFILSTIPYGLFFNEINKQLINLNNYNSINKNYSSIINKSYIISPLFDKITFLYAKPITWWSGVDNDIQYNKIKNKLVNTVKILLLHNETVYVYTTRRFLKKQFKDFEKEGIGFKHIRGNLYKLYLKNENEPINN